MAKRPPAFWDERYSVDDYVFGTEPNAFLTTVADKIKKQGRILSLCDGEGRNGTFLAEMGYEVLSLDASKVGLKKAKKLAKSKKVKIETLVADLENYKIQSRHWDAIVLIFGHFDPELRNKVLSSIPKGLKKGGLFILEAYSPKQLKYKTGGPDDKAKLYDLKDVTPLLEGMEFEIARMVVRDVVEGDAHTGKAAVTQVVARKI
jgi:SAM-dependent methyltransferase